MWVDLHIGSVSHQITKHINSPHDRLIVWLFGNPEQGSCGHFWNIPHAVLRCVRVGKSHTSWSVHVLHLTTWEVAQTIDIYFLVDFCRAEPCLFSVTVAFHAVLTSYTTIAEGSAVVCSADVKNSTIGFKANFDASVNRQVRQTWNVDVRVNVDVAFHPVGTNTPQSTALFILRTIYLWKDSLFQESVSKKNNNFWEYVVSLYTKEDSQCLLLSVVCPAGWDCTSTSTHTSTFHVCRTCLMKWPRVSKPLNLATWTIFSMSLLEDRPAWRHHQSCVPLSCIFEEALSAFALFELSFSETRLFGTYSFVFICWSRTFSEWPKRTAFYLIFDWIRTAVTHVDLTCVSWGRFQAAFQDKIKSELLSSRSPEGTTAEVGRTLFPLVEMGPTTSPRSCWWICRELLSSTSGWTTRTCAPLMWNWALKAGTWRRHAVASQVWPRVRLHVGNSVVGLEQGSRSM